MDPSHANWLHDGDVGKWEDSAPLNMHLVDNAIDANKVSKRACIMQCLDANKVSKSAVMTQCQSRRCKQSEQECIHHAVLLSVACLLTACICLAGVHHTA